MKRIREPIHPFRPEPRCPACATIYESLTAARAQVHSKGAFLFGICAGVKQEHLHYYCQVCGKEWLTVCAPSLPSPQPLVPKQRNELPMKDGKCLTCENSGVVEHGGKVHKCPDCWRGSREAELWADGEGLPTMIPMSKA